jgi:hypothetical protein
MVKCDIRIAEYAMTQVEDSGHHTLQENTGNRWNMEAVFRPNFLW